MRCVPAHFMRETRTCSLRAGRRLARKRASSDPTIAEPSLLEHESSHAALRCFARGPEAGFAEITSGHRHPKSVVREIRTLRSVGAGGGRLPPATRWSPEKTAWLRCASERRRRAREHSRHCSTILQSASGSKTLIAVAVSVVLFPKSFWSSTPSWLIMKVITPELPYSAG